jgi:hypothetical protein
MVCRDTCTGERKNKSQSEELDHVYESIRRELMNIEGIARCSSES